MAGLLSRLFGNQIGYGAQPGGVAGNYGGMLNGGQNTSPMGNPSDILLGIGSGLLSQGPSSTPISPFQGIGQGLQYANQLGQQRRATGQQQFQNQLLSQDAARQQQAFELSNQKATREQAIYDQQQARQKAYADTITDPQQQAAFYADPADYMKNMMPAPTDVMKNYRASGGDAKWGDISAYQKFLAQAGANNVTVNQPPQEGAFQQHYGAAGGDAASSMLYKTIPAAQSELSNLSALKGAVGALQAAGGDVGKLAPLKQTATELMQSFGLDPTAVGLPADAGLAEAITAITNQLALQARNTANGQGMPGSMSDADRAFLQASVPSIKDTPLGLQMKIDVAERVAKRQTEAAAKWQNYPQTQAGWSQFQNDWIKYNNDHPVFGKSDREKAAALAAQAQMPVAQPGVSQAPLVSPTLPGGFN